MNLYLKKVSSEYLQDLASLPDTEFPIHILRKHLEQEILDLKYVNEYKPIQALFDKPLNELTLESLKSIEKTVKEFDENPDFKRLVANASKQRANLIEDIYCYNKETLRRGADLRHPKLATFVNNDANLIKKGDVLYEDLGFSLDVDDSEIQLSGIAPNFDHEPIDFGLVHLQVIEPRLFARTEKSDEPLDEDAVTQIKEEEKNKALGEVRVLGSSDENKFFEFDGDKNIEDKISCRCLVGQEMAGKSIAEYKMELTRQLERARTNPLNVDELSRLKSMAKAQTEGKIQAKAAVVRGPLSPQELNDYKKREKAKAEAKREVKREGRLFEQRKRAHAFHPPGIGLVPGGPRNPGLPLPGQAEQVRQEAERMNLLSTSGSESDNDEEKKE
jgi:hypothetical protein